METPTSHDFFASTPKGMEILLVQELRDLGATALRQVRAGVSFRGSLTTAYRVCLYSRLASRIIMPLSRFLAEDPESLYDGVRKIPWERHLSREGTLAVDFTGTNSKIRHTRFGAQKVKDAIVDRFRKNGGIRPSVQFEHPDLRINIRLREASVSVGLDLSGESLHRRGYRVGSTPAPLKENLAAAILLVAGWPAIARQGKPFLDPMCGSGTLAIEAALMAGGIAPGLFRERFGFSGWLGHDAKAWSDLKSAAWQHAEASLQHLPPLFCFDTDPEAILAVRRNLARVGLAGRVVVEEKEIARLRAPPEQPTGLLVVNPPYGLRLESTTLPDLYRTLGQRLKTRFAGWKTVVFSGNTALSAHLGYRPKRIGTLFNGALECELLFFQPSPPGPRKSAAARKKGKKMFRNSETFCTT